MDFTKEEASDLIKTIFEWISKIERLDDYPHKEKDLKPYRDLLSKMVRYRDDHFLGGDSDPFVDIKSVGLLKPVGYIHALDMKEIGMTPDEIIKFAVQRGLQAKHFIDGFSGETVYVYDKQILQNLLSKNKEVLESEHWPTSPDEFVVKIAHDVVPRESVLFNIVADAFADTENRM